MIISSNIETFTNSFKPFVLISLFSALAGLQMEAKRGKEPPNLKVYKNL